VPEQKPCAPLPSPVFLSGHCPFVTYSFVYFWSGLPWGEAMFPVTSPSPMAVFWEQTGFSRFSQWWQGAHVRQGIFHSEKETKIASDLICNFPRADGI
jgi:hypothetical protein